MTAAPVVVLVHGVGIGGWAFSEVAAALAADRRVLVPDRRGYGPEGSGGGNAATLDEQVGDLLELAGSLDVPSATWVGVSGGATLVLALAMAAPRLVRAAVVHEPAFGPMAPDLHRALTSAAARLAAGGDPLEFMAALVGEDRLAALPPVALETIAAHGDVIRAEVPAFVGFAPAAADLARLAAVHLVASVGSTSPARRRRAASILADRAGARVAVLDGACHLPHLEAPAEFVSVIRAAEAEAPAASPAGLGPSRSTALGSPLVG